MSVLPTDQQLADLIASTEEGPLVMLNLLRFNERADGVDEGISGAQADARYSAATRATERAPRTRGSAVPRRPPATARPRSRSSARWEVGCARPSRHRRP